MQMFVSNELIFRWEDFNYMEGSCLYLKGKTGYISVVQVTKNQIISEIKKANEKEKQTEKLQKRLKK